MRQTSLRSTTFYIMRFIHHHQRHYPGLAEVQIVELFPIIADHIVVLVGRLTAHAAAAAAVVVHREPRVAQRTVNRTARYRVLATGDKITAHRTQVLGRNGLAGCTILMDHFLRFEWVTGMQWIQYWVHLVQWVCVGQSGHVGQQGEHGELQTIGAVAGAGSLLGGEMFGETARGNKREREREIVD